MVCKHIYLRRYNDVSKDLVLECVKCKHKIVLKRNGEKYEYNSFYERG